MTQWTKIEWSTAVDSSHGVRIYRLSGVLTDTREAFDFIEQVRGDLHSDPRPVLLDLENVERLTSAGVGMIATVYTSAKNVDRRVALCGLNTIVRRILEIVQITRFIAIYATAAEALNASAGSGWDRS